jgi:putative tryptophan/tyrosine transport system substrate-binding protein
MKRREFVAGLGISAVWPHVVRAQRTQPVIGFLYSGSLEGEVRLLAAFRRGLGEVGYVEGRNVSIENRWADDQYERLPVLAAELVRRQASVIFAGGPPAALAVKAATTTIPVVFTSGADPVRLGLVASLNLPGGNVTGMSILNVELGPKRLELLRELLPTATTAALLINPTYAPSQTQSNDLRDAARQLGLRLYVLHASVEGDLDRAFASLVQQGAQALVIGNDPFLNDRRERLVALALRHAMPAISQYREFATAGGLMSYGGDITDVYRKAGIYVGRILKGEKPSDLPVQQSTKVELVINLKTAKALGITFPQTLLGRADEVIE